MTLSKKMAVSFFFATTFTLLFGMLLLFSSTSHEAAKMNAEINQKNLEVARSNIEKKIKSVEMSILGAFFQEDVRNGLIQEDAILDIEAFNKIDKSLTSLRAMAPEILAVAIYPKDGGQAILSGGGSRLYNDYQSCVDYFEEKDVALSSFYTSSKWVGLEYLHITNHSQQNCFVNIRVIREIKHKEPIALMVVYYDERAISRMYEFFGAKSFALDKRGLVVSAVDKGKIGSSYFETELYPKVLTSNQRAIAVGFHENGAAVNGFSIYLSTLDCFLIAVPDEILLNATREATLNTLALLTIIGLVFSFTSAILVARGLTRPITKLKLVMEKVLMGDLGARFVGNGTDEASFLGNTFNILLDSISDYIEAVKHSGQLKTEAEMKFLQSQINPHLLYNTLDSALYFLSLEDNETAAKTVDELSKFFKLSLSNDNLYVTIATEIHHVRCYMELQRICRRKNIELKITGSERLQNAEIVKTTLQPIVENAFLHAYEGSLNDGQIEIAMSSNDGDMTVAITDDGMGIEDGMLAVINERLSAEVNKSSSFGLWNVNRRLKTCYGEKYGLSIESEFGEYTRVTVTIPLRIQEGSFDV